MIKLQQLAHALALGRLGTFRRAAQAQHLSQPAFSRSIRSLEDSLGVALFERQGPITRPTAFGEALLRRAQIVLEEVGELQREIRLLQGLEAGCFSVAMGAYAADLSARQALGILAKQYPHLRCGLRLRSWRDVADLVASREVDVGIAEISTAEDDKRLDVESVGQHDVVLYCRRGHPLLQRESISDSDLDAFPLASIRIPPRGAAVLPGMWSLDPESGDLIPHIEVDDVATAQVVVRESDAIGFATPLQFATWLGSGDLAVLPYRRPWLRLDYGFITLRGRMRAPAAERFMAIVREIEAEIAGRNQDLLRRLFSDPNGEMAGTFALDDG